MIEQRDHEQFCIITSHPYPEAIGGEETFIRQFTVFLKSKRLPYTIVSTYSSRVIDVDPVTVPMFSLPLVGYEVYSFLFITLALLKIMDIHSRKRVGILYSVETGYAGLAAVLAGKILGLPTIVHSHTRRSEALRNIRHSMQDWRTWPYWVFERFLDRLVSLNADGVIAVSDDVRDYLNSLGVPIERIRVAPSAVEVERFTAQGEVMGWKRRIDPEAFVIGYIGRLEEIKGIGVLLDAYADFRRRSMRSSYLIIGGDGKDRRRFERQVREHNMPNVRFIGFQKDVPSFLRSIDVFVFPSFQEGSPIALLEAMVAGCPTIATSIPGVNEIADDCIILVPPRDPIALTDALLRLASDSKLRATMSKAARAKGFGFSSEKIMPEILEFCQSVSR